MILVRHGEIFTKSEPVRKRFVIRLAKNIQEALPYDRIETRRWRIFVHPKNEKKSLDVLSRVFGIVSFSTAESCEINLESMKKLVNLSKFKSKKFAVKTQRLEKEGPLSSNEINNEIGDFIRKNAKAKVNLDNPQITLGIEIYEGKAFIFTETFQGPGGLPLGTADGIVQCDFKTDNDVIAAWMIMKRGAVVVPIHKKLKRWAYGASEKGEVLARVSGVTDPKEFVKLQEREKLPVFVPLIGLSDKEIKELKRKIF